MNKFVYFLAVGLAFTVLQVGAVEAAHTATHTSASGTGGTMVDDPDCPVGTVCGGDAASHPCSGMTGDALITCTEENPPPSGTSAAGAPPVLTIDDPLCVVAPALRDPDCPNAMPGTGATMAPPAGNGMNRMPGAAPMAPPTTAAGTPPMCPGPLGTMIPCPAPGDGGPPPCPEGTVCDDPCISLETQALKDACHAEHSDEHGTSGGDSGDRDREANQEEQERRDRDRERTEREESGR